MKTYPIVVLGATGFTGRLAVEYLNQRYPDLKYAVTARSKTRLEVRHCQSQRHHRRLSLPSLPPPIARAGAQAADFPPALLPSLVQELKPLIAGSPNAVLQLCDVSDPASLDSVVQSAVCVMNFAGSPFIDKALPVVESCAKHGTHYVDITGSCLRCLPCGYPEPTSG